METSGMQGRNPLKNWKLKNTYLSANQRYSILFNLLQTKENEGNKEIFEEHNILVPSFYGC